MFSSLPTAMAGWWCGMLQLTTYRLAPHEAQPWLTYLLGAGFLLFGALSLSIYMFGRPQALVPPPLRGRDPWRNS
jgi:hypothetical protein